MLKLCRDLADYGIEVDVLAPDDPRFAARDPELVSAIPAGTTVHRAPLPRLLGRDAGRDGSPARAASGPVSRCTRASPAGGCCCPTPRSRGCRTPFASVRA